VIRQVQRSFTHSGSFPNLERGDATCVPGLTTPQRFLVSYVDNQDYLVCVMVRLEVVATGRTAIRVQVGLRRRARQELVRHPAAVPPPRTATPFVPHSCQPSNFSSKHFHSVYSQKKLHIKDVNKNTFGPRRPKTSSTCWRLSGAPVRSSCTPKTPCHAHYVHVGRNNPNRIEYTTSSFPCPCSLLLSPLSLNYSSQHCSHEMVSPKQENPWP